MLEFINNNGVLFSGIFSIVGALIAAVVAVVKENKANRKDTIASLHKEVAELKSQLATTEGKLQDALSVEKAESLIDKTKGSIYYEKVVKDPKPKLMNIKLEKLHPFRSHPYKVLDDSSMTELVESIKDTDC